MYRGIQTTGKLVFAGVQPLCAAMQPLCHSPQFIWITRRTGVNGYIVTLITWHNVHMVVKHRLPR